jgi:2-hydroxy-3-keto-5-methylthiopentenyl-1-phosphate phosphatase
MSPKKKFPVAICYDFDGTLIRGNMQENSFIPDLGVSKESFWAEVKEAKKQHDMDEVLAYMELMMRKAEEKNQPFSKQSLADHGKSVSLFPGVQDWFGAINQAGKTLGLDVEHYIISSGIDEMIKGSPIGHHFKHIFASGFAYSANEVPKFAARSVNYTTKTQYLFRINKGVLNSWDNSINSVMNDSDRPRPFSHMIYLGDGETDVPAMKMLNYQGGYSIAVYPPREGTRRTKEEAKKKQIAEGLHKDNRAQFVAEADYSANKPLFKLVATLLERIANEESFEMNRDA